MIFSFTLLDADVKETEESASIIKKAKVEFNQGVLKGLKANPDMVEGFKEAMSETMSEAIDAAVFGRRVAAETSLVGGEHAKY